jgi:hypothetical protein
MSIHNIEYTKKIKHIQSNSVACSKPPLSPLPSHTLLPQAPAHFETGMESTLAVAGD